MKKILTLFLLTTTITVPAWCDTCSLDVNCAQEYTFYWPGNNDCHDQAEGLTGDLESRCKSLPGCYYQADQSGSGQCLNCGEGTYTTGGYGQCHDCPLTHPNSYTGAKKEEACFAGCVEMSIHKDKHDTTSEVIGKRTPQFEHVHYPNTDCQYKTTCKDTTESLCTDYHEIPGASDGMTDCESNTREVTADCQNGKCIAIYNPDDPRNEWGPYYTECNDPTEQNGFHPITPVKDPLNNPEKTLCNRPLYSACKPNTHACDSDNNVPKSITTNEGTFSGTVTGNAYWIENTIGEDNYNYKNCTWTIGESSIVPNGTGSATCQWDTENNQWGELEYTIITCEPGYYAGTDAKTKGCTEVGKGYYSPANDINRYKCPPGSTTEGKTSSAITECKIEGGTTQICDGDGKCFTLPGTDKIAYSKTDN